MCVYLLKTIYVYTLYIYWIYIYGRYRMKIYDIHWEYLKDIEKRAFSLIKTFYLFQNKFTTLFSRAKCFWCRTQILRNKREIKTRRDPVNIYAWQNTRPPRKTHYSELIKFIWQQHRAGKPHTSMDTFQHTDGIKKLLTQLIQQILCGKRSTTFGL